MFCARKDNYLINLKPFARFLYANVPGAAAARFGLKDILASYISKREYYGVLLLSIGNGLIVDVGANRGHSIAAFKRLIPHSTIVAFEPGPTLSRRLIEQFQQNPDVKVFGCALGAASGSVTFYVPTYGRWECDGMSATSRNAATDWLGDPGRMFLFNEAKLKINEYLVEIRTLNSYEFEPALIKLHAQGMELDILKGAHQTIRRHQPALMCAFPWPALVEQLKEWGYDAYSFSDGRFQPGVPAASVTFTWFLANNHKRLIQL